MITALIGASWAIVATVDVPYHFDVVAHRNLDLVTVTTVGGKSSSAYNSQGVRVKTLVSPRRRDDGEPRDHDMAMTRNGEIVHIDETTDVETYTKHPWDRRLWIRMELLADHLPISVQINDRYLYSVTRSWDKRWLYVPRPDGRVRVTAPAGRLLREIRLRSRITGLQVEGYILWPLPRNRLLALGGFSSSSRLNPHDIKIPGVRIVESSRKPKFDDQWVTSYLSIIDVATGLTTPILGLRQRTGEGDLVRVPMSAAIFNDGRSIATLFDGKLYILTERH